MDDEEVCYALKLLDVGEGHELDPEQKKRALRQAQGLLVLHHTNIVHKRIINVRFEDRRSNHSHAKLSPGS